MRDIARRYKAAIMALGAVDGVRFATQQVFGKRTELSLSFVEDDVKHHLWARADSTDLAIFVQIYRQQDYNIALWPPYQEHVDAQYQSILSATKVPLIIDGGANAGYSPIWFALKYPQARVLAIEPDPENFAVLKRNVAPFHNITAVEAALWNERAIVSVLDSNDWAWGRRFDVTAAGPGIPTVTVRELLDSDLDYAPFIVKIDIEGAETKLLRSNNEWMDDFPLVIFEPHDSLYHWLGVWQGSAHSFFSTLARRKREYLTKGENVFAFLHPQH